MVSGSDLPTWIPPNDLWKPIREAQATEGRRLRLYEAGTAASSSGWWLGHPSEK